LVELVYHLLGQITQRSAEGMPKLDNDTARRYLLLGKSQQPKPQDTDQQKFTTLRIEHLLRGICMLRKAGFSPCYHLLS
jgi:hypothetical protein